MAMLDITTNIGCSVNCSYCPQHIFVCSYSKKSNVQKMTFETFKACIDKVPDGVGLSFAGFSEPWLNSDCTKMLLYAHEKGHDCIHVSTTLVGMKADDINMIENIPFAAFKVHLPGKSGYEAIDVDDNYMNVLKKVRASKIKATYRFHDRRLNSKVESYIGDEAFRVMTIPRSISTPSVVDVSAPRKRRGVIKCKYTSDLRFNVLLPDGNVLLCPQDFAIKHLLGNLLAHDYESLFQGERFLKVMKGLNDNTAEIAYRYCLVSCNVKPDFNCFVNLLNTDIIFLINNARVFLRKYLIFN